MTDKPPFDFMNFDDVGMIVSLDDPDPMVYMRAMRPGEQPVAFVFNRDGAVEVARLLLDAVDKIDVREAERAGLNAQLEL